MLREKRLTVLEFYTARFNPMDDDVRIKVILDTLFDVILSEAQPTDSQVLCLQTGYRCSYKPIKYNGHRYCLWGSPDYILRYGTKKVAVNFVVVRARKLAFACCTNTPRDSCCGPAQLLAYMGMCPIPDQSVS